MTCHRKILSILLLAIAVPVTALATEPPEDVIHQLQKRWAEVNYQLEGKTQLTAFEALVDDANALVTRYPDSAQLLTWRGIIQSSFAGAKGGLGAMKLAKASRADLEQAMNIDDHALQGAAYTSLGALYFKVPGWPVGFGDDDKAESLLLEALKMNPDGIDPNYFYGDFLLDQKRYTEAEKALIKAQQAPARSDRPVADAGRQQEIELALLEVRKKLHN
jgi:tetratricopeptide (TPR) repeat protein